MFDQTFVDAHAHTRKPWTVALSFAGQSLVVGGLLVIPILHPEILHPKLDTPIFVHLQPAQQIVHEATAVRSTSSAHSMVRHVFVTPTSVPTCIKRVVDTDFAPAAADAFPVAGFGGSDVLSAIGQSILPEVPAPKPQPKPQPSVTPPAGPVRVSEGVQAARLIFGPKPAYPSLARVAHVEGRVRMQAIIAPDGTINSLQVISGPALLISAARDAVAQWRYQPTLLSGKAVEVITEIDVNFMLGH